MNQIVYRLNIQFSEKALNKKNIGIMINIVMNEMSI